MGYPIIKPPVCKSVLFSMERRDDSGSVSRQPLDPSLHPLFGIPITDQWPQHTEFQVAYCSKDRLRCPLPPCLCLPPANVPGRQGERHQRGPTCHNMPRMRRSKGEQALDQLYDPVPWPIEDKHYRRHYYKIDDPIGVITKEEVAGCRQTAQGPQKITVQDMMESTYTPNYRYKKWVTQPQTDIIRQFLDTPSPVCHLPKPDTRYWDLYNRVRMHRPSPQLTENQFVPCRAVPIPINNSRLFDTTM